MMYVQQMLLYYCSDQLWIALRALILTELRTDMFNLKGKFLFYKFSVFACRYA